MMVRTRFAPSPTGPLHLGHAFAAIFAHDLAQQSGGEFLLRIEDIDRTRSRPRWEQQIYDDLAWLGLGWTQPVLRQSERLPVYDAALDQLWDRGLLFQCHCNRRDIADASSAPHHGPDGLIYPGTCRGGPRTGPRPEGVLRLDMNAAMCAAGGEVAFNDNDQNEHRSAQYMRAHIGDVVVARRDMGTSYHLAVTLDDAAQQITHVTRGEDLREATPIHVLLQKLLDLPVPLYLHHRLILDEQGRRLAKRDDARAIALYRGEGASPADIRRMIGN